MRKLKLLGLLGTAVIAAAFCVHIARSQSTTRTLDVTVQTPPPPANMSFSCGPSNLRSSGGVLTMSWALGTAQYANIDGIGRKDASGSQNWVPGICSGCDRTFYANFFTSEGQSALLSCTVGMHCFLKGTKILMEGGTYKNIEDVQVGDKVMSYDAELGKFVGAAVVKTTKNDMDKYYIVNDTLKITPGHILMVNGQWAMSNNMKVGDHLLNANGERVAITSLKEIDAAVDVYNLITDEPHDFFADNYLVHNENQLKAHADRGLAAGMKIAMADGRELAIEQIKAGDKILSFDPKLKRYAISVVRQTGKQSVNKTVLINGTLRVAKGHQLFLVPPASKFKKAK
ncbi:MAG: polymorphic toxin-type HINT domain-containing protein [candidate division NC10 bacterium]